MILPLGDLADLATIQAEQAIQGDLTRLAALAKRYGATDYLVAEGAFAISPETGLPQLEVTVTRYGSTQSEQTMLLSFAAQGDEGETGLLRRAAFEVAAQVEDHWKRDNLIRFGEAAVTPIVVPVRGLGDWIEVRKRLSSIAVIKDTELVLLSRHEARVNLHYLGSLAQLALALEQADLRLWDSGGIFVLELNRGQEQGERVILRRKPHRLVKAGTWEAVKTERRVEHAFTQQYSQSDYAGASSRRPFDCLVDPKR